MKGSVPFDGLTTTFNEITQIIILLKKLVKLLWIYSRYVILFDFDLCLYIPNEHYFMVDALYDLSNIAANPQQLLDFSTVGHHLHIVLHLNDVLFLGRFPR